MGKKNYTCKNCKRKFKQVGSYFVCPHCHYNNLWGCFSTRGRWKHVYSERRTR